ncbi:MAG: PAS domain S-box protein [Xenococcaceae cyanobacterium]
MSKDLNRASNSTSSAQMVCQRKVMLIEDNPEDRSVYRRYLQRDSEYRYRFIEAELGEEAFTIVGEERPDLILLDYLLPDMDGLEWLNLWQQQSKETLPPVIVITGQGDENIAVQFLKLGATDYLTKSKLTPEKLILEVNRAIAEHQLRSQHEETLLKLQLATEASELGMWFWDLTKDNLEFTLQCKKLFGLDPEAEINYQIFLNTLHPEDRARTDVAIRQALQNQTDYSIEYRVIISDGSVHWIAAKGKGFYNSEGEPVRMMGTVQDISDRKRAEAELVKTNNILQSIISDTPDVIVVKDLEGRYVNANQAAANWLGITVGEMLGKDDTQLFPPQIARSIMEMDRQVITEQKFVSYEEEIPLKQTTRMLLTSKYPWRDATGSVLGVIGISRDITALKESERKLKANEQLLRLALSSAKAGSWDWNIATEEIIWSPENYDLYGLDPKQGSLIYQDWEKFIHLEDRKTLDREIKAVLAGESEEFRSEFQIIHPQKGVRWLLGIGNVTCNEEGKPIRLSGINLDITERKLIEENLRNSERHLRRVLDSLFSFVGVLTPDGILIEVNRTALNAANLQLDDVINKHFTETYWWSYDPQIQAQLNNAISRAARGENVHYDVKVRLGAEKYILIDFSLIPLFDVEGQVEYLIPSGIDITDREASKQALKESEDELRLITEVIPQQIWTALPDGKVDYVNRRWKEFTGIPLKQMKDRGWEIIVHPDDLERVKQNWTEAIKSGKKYNIEARLRKKDGTYRWFLGRARPLRNKEGKILKWYGTNTDITLIKELEEKLREQTEDLIQANRLKDEFLAIVSHELRTPLNPILGWSQLLATGRLDAEKTTQGIEIIQRNAKLQVQLINDLLDVSRILRGKLELKVTPLNLESIIKSALATVQLSAEAKSIQITTEFEPNIGQVSGDARRLQQIVWNLLSNAIKFTPEGGQVNVTLERVENQALMKIRDTGQGIASDFLPYVFDRFRQAENVTTRKFGGLGLGLAIVRHLTEIHGGSVSVTSPGEGQGATFSVKLPLMNTPNTDRGNNNSSLEAVKPDRFNNLRVLVIEDEIDSRDILTLVLEQEGATVTPVKSASEALAAIKNSTFDLIVSDIGMPQIDGYTLMKQIRALPQGKNIPAIALTAYAGEVDRQHSLEAGYQSHISKPINIPKLIDIIVQLV